MSSDKRIENGIPPARSSQPRYDSQNAEKQQEKSEEAAEQRNDSRPNQPAGGFDTTPIPHAPPGYTVKITFHRAMNLPMADVNSFSSDPYILAQINTKLRPRHKEDPCLRMRTPTVRKNTDPVWNWEWIVANIPASGFRLKARIYDEDPADHDDRLGNVTIDVENIQEGWEGINEQAYKIRKRMGSQRAYAIRAVARCFQMAKHMHGYVYISIELLGRTEDDDGGRAYTLGPQWWTRHYSPLLGRIANRKEPDDGETGCRRKAERYKYVAVHALLEFTASHTHTASKPISSS